ncbi:hypothetical protein EDB83DRAFT_2511599 [Lactarius deliciosus]|nr:hypothetical protein EDB83DRAFT_2511599 [Lactarius deliciosus]
MGLTDLARAAVGSVFGATETVDTTEDTSSSFLDRIGDAVLGHSAESETKDAPVIAPQASTTPVTHGRRSQGPSGKDVFHSQEPAPAAKS